ncbi:siderophore-interacting protein [Catelliglobosispora koreensis]|uniref:siderophore-interacting protein n=1 Tax=Catelliglobosispora koreensis TaxID=129052 RepID=UPI00037C6B0A|nr:siderophore-interacting protein [Catelliglobosispora koreensis]
MILPWRFFDVEVARLRRLSRSFLRVTVTGEDLKVFADNGFDQRFKLILPLPESGLASFPFSLDWHEKWRALPESQRNPVRTYTVRAVRPEVSEVDIDMVVHPGGDGPAVVWVRDVAVGDQLALLGPDARFGGPHGGIDFRLPASATTILIAGDETAVPAVASILECLPRDISGEVILEVPEPGDFLDLTAPVGIKIEWLARDGAVHGSALVPALTAAAARLVPQQAAGELPDVDVDEQILWEVPDEPAPDKQVYAWLAGEAGVIRSLRRHLVGERGLDRRSVAFMGYWRLGRSEGV